MKYKDNQEGLDALKAYVLATGGRQIAEAILADAKAECPVKTGRLRDSLRIVEDDDALFIGSDLDYVRYVEDGTSRMKGRHFLRRALYKVRFLR